MVGEKVFKTSVMLHWTILVFFYFVALSCVSSKNSVVTEESLRQNIEDLLAGKLKFHGGDSPSYKKELLDSTPTNGSEYDFIIVGAGSAGATIASRLSESKKFTVLLIEAGIEEYPLMDVPRLAVALQLSDEINWKYKAETSSTYCLGLIDAKCIFPRGKVMGGSSVLNYMLATRGNRRDYDNWAKITGDNSWSYKQMLKYLMKLENYSYTGVEIDWSLHNRNGPVHITNAPYQTPLAKEFINAGLELGYPAADYNGREQIGFCYYQSTVRNGERWSTNRAYLHPAKYRKNLILTRNSHVQKVLIDERTMSAYGVRFSKFNQIYEVRAKKEVILSAGAINSPQILMLSGIGPAKMLADLNINVIRDAPVGENFMDHLVFGGLIFTTNDSTIFPDTNFLDSGNPAINDYVTKRNGTLAQGVGFEGIAYVNVDDPNPLNDDPNIEILFDGTAGIADPLASKILGISEAYRDIIISDLHNQSTWSLLPMIMKPKSRGKLVLRSSNPMDKPKIYANFLSDTEDIRVLIKGIRMAIALSRTNAFQKYGSKLYKIPSLCEKYQFDSDAYWECALRTSAFSTYHQSGTCRMGREDDAKSIVDSQLKVIGIKGLRVADASVMPEIVSAHPNIPTIAIGEKVSDLIKRNWDSCKYSYYLSNTWY